MLCQAQDTQNSFRSDKPHLRKRLAKGIEQRGLTRPAESPLRAGATP
jgi:hypothetical protein